MAILKLYGAKIAMCTRRVATVLHELKIDLMAGEHKTPAFMKNQPFGQIPYIDDDGFILYETRAICRYIAAKYPASGLVPTEPKANALFEQAAAVELTNFDPSASLIAVEKFKQTYLGVQPDQALLDAQLEILDKKLDAYDVILGKQRYVAGDKLTLADLFHVPHAPMVGAVEGDIMTRKPNVARWYKELVEQIYLRCPRILPGAPKTSTGPKVQKIWISSRKDEISAQKVTVVTLTSPKRATWLGFWRIASRESLVGTWPWGDQRSGVRSLPIQKVNKLLSGGEWAEAENWLSRKRRPAVWKDNEGGVHDDITKTGDICYGSVISAVPD
ncbi:glutathione S-transferase [Mycena galopus ATCC 62051]|nr:glutathione S-transferase [Mycena galopus ATCC 62051]